MLRLYDTPCTYNGIEINNMSAYMAYNEIGRIEDYSAMIYGVLLIISSQIKKRARHDRLTGHENIP